MSHYEIARTRPRHQTQQNVAEQVRQLQQELERQLRSAQDSAASASMERVREVQRRQAQQMNESITSLNERINALDETARRNLEEMDRHHREQLSHLTDRVYEDINTAQQRLANSVSRQIDHLASDVSDQLQGLDTRIQSQQRDINAINEQMDVLTQGIGEIVADIDQHFERNEQEIASIQQRFADEDANARAAVDMARALMETVKQRTLLDRFAPGYEAQDLRHRIDSLVQSHNHGAVLTAQAEEAITQIWQVESHATQEKAKHDAMVEITQTQVERVLTVINENREIEQPVEGGEPMKVENEFWSEGEYGRLEQELAGLKAELEDRYNTKLTKERIEAIARRSAEIEGRILQIGAESVAKAILSEARVETVEDIVNAMESKGWTLKGGEVDPQFNYMGGEVDHDWRKGVCAVLENNLDEEITVIVDPDETNSQNRLIVHQETSKTGMTEKKVHEQMQTIQNQMRDLGYELGESQAGVAAIPEMGSAERLGRAHATEQIRQQIQQ